MLETLTDFNNILLERKEHYKMYLLSEYFLSTYQKEIQDK